VAFIFLLASTWLQASDISENKQGRKMILMNKRCFGEAIP
jgi:hypothetical protein